MYEPEVSIITPTYNLIEAQKTDDFYLQINLLDKQTYPYIEHIIMDNSSSDGTQDLLKEYKNNGYISFFSAPDNGKYDAINKGIDRAKGKYVAILSCDDFYHDITGISDVVTAMEENEADYCVFPTYCIQPDNSVFEYIPSILNVFQVSPCSRQAVIFKKDTLLQMGAFDSKFRLLAHYDLMIRLVMNNANGIYYDKNIATYHLEEQVIKHSGQVIAESSHIYHKNYRSLYPLTDEIIDRIVQISEIPRPLLEIFSKYFPEQEEEFYERYNQMYEMRLNNAKLLREQERNNRRI